MIVNSRSFMNFSVGILQSLIKLVQVVIFELIICNATGTGMPVKKALTSNETKVSSGFIESEHDLFITRCTNGTSIMNHFTVRLMTHIARCVFAAILRGQHPATHSAFLRRISLCDGELDCADVAGSA